MAKTPRAPKTTNLGRKKRKTRQRLKERYAKKREEAQLAGVIPTSAEGAVRNEVVDPASQDDQPLPGLIGTAIRRGWAVPEERKPKLVDEMTDIVANPEAAEVVKVMAYNALTRGDQVQYERDNPELAGKAKGGGMGVNVVNQVNVLGDLKELMKRVQEQRECKVIEDRIREASQVTQTANGERTRGA